MNNTSIGNKTEKSVSQIFRERGYWVYNCQKTSSGSQPVDLIAIKGGERYLVWFVDGKHVRSHEVSFALNRIEPNQWATLKYANEFAKIDIKNLGFAIHFERTGFIYWLSYKRALEMQKNNEKSINLIKLPVFEEVLDEHSNK